MIHHVLEQLGECLPFVTSLIQLSLYEMTCSQHPDGVFIPVLDLQKHKKLEKTGAERHTCSRVVISCGCNQNHITVTAQ